jgi:hypothetical protein
MSYTITPEPIPELPTLHGTFESQPIRNSILQTLIKMNNSKFTAMARQNDVSGIDKEGLRKKE